MNYLLTACSGKMNWGKESKCEACRAFYLFCNEFNKFNNTRSYLSYDIKITLKSHFLRKKVTILSLCTQHCYGRYIVS